MTAGRPRKPVEQKRALGNPGRRPLPKLSTVSVLPMADGTPPPPTDLLLEGRDLWERAWNQAITWLSPVSDFKQVEHACRLADDLAVARKIYRTTRSGQDGRLVVHLSTEFMKALGTLGFTPSSRSQLGVAEVKRVSALEQLLSNSSKR